MLKTLKDAENLRVALLAVFPDSINGASMLSQSGVLIDTSALLQSDANGNLCCTIPCADGGAALRLYY